MRWLGPWSASSGAQKSASATPPPSSSTASAAKRIPLLFDDDVLKGGPGKYREDGVVESEEAQVAARVVRDGRAHAADDDRDREREEEERQQQLAGTPGHGHRGHKRADGADAHVREQDGRDGGRVDGLEKDGEGGERHRLHEHEERERRDQLREPDRAAVAGREHERVQQALLALGDEGAAEGEERGEDDRDPEQALRGLGLLAREREAEGDEGGDDEEQHRRQHLAAAQLQEEILAGQGGGVADVVGHAQARRPVARGARRSGSCVATRKVRSPASAASSRSRSAAPSASSALNGSSRSRRAGACRSARQSASRCSIPRENEPAPSARASQSPKRSSSIPIRSRRSGTR